MRRETGSLCSKLGLRGVPCGRDVIQLMVLPVVAGIDTQNRYQPETPAVKPFLHPEEEDFSMLFWFNYVTCDWPQSAAGCFHLLHGYGKKYFTGTGAGTGTKKQPSLQVISTSG